MAYKVGDKSKGKKDEKVSLGADYRKKMMVTLYGTEQNPYHKTGQPFEIHKDQSERLISRGWATENEPEEKQEEGGDDEK